MTFNYYIENLSIIERIKDMSKSDPVVRDNFFITDSGEKADTRFRVWSLATGTPKVVATGFDDSDLKRLQRRFNIEDEFIFDVAS